MSSPTPAELQAMRALAEKATQGEVKVYPDYPRSVIFNHLPANGNNLHFCRTAEDAAFIAAAHPQAVIALIDALVSARAALQRIEHLCKLCTRDDDTGPSALREILAIARAHLGGQAPE